MSASLSFTQGLHRALQRAPEARATVCEGRTRSFRQLEQDVARLAGALLNAGLRSEDRVAVLSLNADHYLTAYLGIPWAGGTIVPLNFRWSEPELVHALNDAQVRILIVDAAHAAQIPALRAACSTLVSVIHTGPGASPDGCLSLAHLLRDTPPVADSERRGDDILGVFYTGGTTGRAKGVLLSHANVCSAALGLMAEGSFDEGAVGLHAAPMFHLADLMMTTGLLLRGGCHVMAPLFRPEAILDLVATHRISDLLLVPAMLQALVDSPAFAAADVSSVSHVLYGASPASESLLDRALGAMPRARFRQVYGMTEAAATITTLSPDAHTPARRSEGRLRSAGQAFCHTRIRVVDDAEDDLPVGQIGQILITGPNVMLGYLNHPDATAEALRGGWLRTGDMGYLDADGYLFIVDRAKDMIISGGENVFSIEVENALASHPSVAACAVFGVPDALWGEAVRAAIVLREGASVGADALIDHCRSLIAPYKCPRHIDFVASLPMSAAGKVLKAQLRRPFWRGLERSVS